MLAAKPPADMFQSDVENAVLGVNNARSTTEFAHVGAKSVGCLRAVLRKDFVGAIADKILERVRYGGQL
jgi:hypothetical protein